MDQKSARVFLPSRENCFERLRLARFGETVTCVHCESGNVVKRAPPAKTHSSTGAMSASHPNEV
jgi:hypothetical protein